MAGAGAAGADADATHPAQQPVQLPVQRVEHHRDLPPVIACTHVTTARWIACTRVTTARWIRVARVWGSRCLRASCPPSRSPALLASFIPPSLSLSLTQKPWPPFPVCLPSSTIDCTPIPLPCSPFPPFHSPSTPPFPRSAQLQERNASSQGCAHLCVKPDPAPHGIARPEVEAGLVLRHVVEKPDKQHAVTSGNRRCTAVERS